MGTPTVTWAAAYEATPAGSDDPRAADDRMREIKVSVRERDEREHQSALAEATARHGVHRIGSARGFYQAAAPTTMGDGTGTRALSSTDDQGRLWINSSTKELKGYDGAAFAALYVGTAGSAAACSGNAATATAATSADRVVDQGGGASLRCKVIAIGTWTMTSSLTIAHGLTASKIRTVQVVIVNDAGTIWYPMPSEYKGALTTDYLGYFWDSTNITLYVASWRIGAYAMVMTGAAMSDWDDSIARGNIYVWYTV
jgi:hypothetical protein